MARVAGPVAHRLPVALLVAGLYFGAAQIGLSMMMSTKQAAAVWPPSGIAIAALLMVGVRVWPGIFLGALMVNATVPGEPLGMAAQMSVVNTLGMLIGYFVLRRVVDFKAPMERTRDVFGLAAAAVITAVVTGTSGVGLLVLHGVVQVSDFPSVLAVWWIGEVMGIFLLVPVLTAWKPGSTSAAPRQPVSWQRRVEAGVGFALLVTVSLVTVGPLVTTSGADHLAFSVFPFVVWAGLRFRPTGAAVAILLVSMIASWGISGPGVFSAGISADTRLVLLELFVAVVAITGATLAAVVAERETARMLQARAAREEALAHAEQKRAEAQLHQSQRLESLGQLAGGVAHDFNNILAVILNYTAFVEEQVSATVDTVGGEAWTAAQQDLRQIDRAARRAAELTHQLLAFGRRDVVRPRVLDLNTVVADIEQFLLRALGKHIRLNTTLKADLHPILADPGQLEQVLVNLAINARDAMPGGGTLTIDTANVTIEDDLVFDHPNLKPGPHVQLRVRDTGTGIPKEIIERVFDPFFTTKPEGKGTGLGLATVYGIVVHAQGDVIIESGAGIGTTFTVLLPIAEEQLPARVEQRRVRHRTAGGETVLVVDDEAALLHVTQRILIRNGYHVHTAGGGVEAVELARQPQTDIHLLVTDIVMPTMLGEELADRMREVQPGIRVLYMSGYAYTALASQGTLMPGVTLLTKPFTEADLLDKVREVLDA